MVLTELFQTHVITTAEGNSLDKVGDLDLCRENNTEKFEDGSVHHLYSTSRGWIMRPSNLNL